MKTCTKCGEEKPDTTEYFYAKSYPEDALKAECKECSKAAVTAWKQRHRDHVNAYQRKRAKALRDGTWG